MPLRIGTRGSALALAQTSRVIVLLRDRLATPAEPVVIRTEGDIDKTSPLTVIGGRGVFTSALEQALLRGAVAAAVHSAKDLPSERPANLDLVAFPEREDARDIVISRHGTGLAHLPPRPTIGTSSRRRALQVRLCRPDARIVELRGNIDSRLRKALETDVDAIVLAAAGVRRMGWIDRATELLPLETFVPSPGQGALAIEARHDDRRVLDLLAQLDDPAVSAAVRAERAFLRTVGGGCTAPIGAHVAVDGDCVHLRAMLGNDEGTAVVWADERFPSADAEAAATVVAHRLASELRSGAGRAVRTTVIATSEPMSADGTPPRSRFSPGTLNGMTVVATRPRGQSSALVAALRARGAEPLELPATRIEDVADPAPLEAAVGRLRDGGYDWVVFTSANAVDRVVARLQPPANGGGLLERTPVAAVGKATAAALRAAGIRVDVVPSRPLAEGLVEALSERHLAGSRVFYPKADGARDVLPDGLRALGATVDAVDAYRTLPETKPDPAVAARLRRGEVDVVTFASPSAVRAVQQTMPELWAAIGRTDVLCVGPVTAAAARTAGLTVRIVADDPTTDGVIDALLRFREGRPLRADPDLTASTPTAAGSAPGGGFAR